MSDESMLEALHEVALDSSCLAKVVDEERVEELIASLSPETRLVLPAETLAEYLDVAPGWTDVRVRALENLWKRISWRLVLARHVSAFLQEEHRAPLTNTPRTAWTTAIVGSLVETADKSPSDFDLLRASIKNELKKEDHYSLDDSFRHSPPMLEWTPELVEASARFMGTEDGFWTGFFIKCVARDDDHRLAMRSSPRRYRFAVTLAAYEFLNGLGTVANAANCPFGAMSKILRSPRRGDWTDARIVAASSYCSVLLTEDKGIRGKVRHISETFGFPLVAHSFDAWRAIRGTEESSQ